MALLRSVTFGVRLATFSALLVAAAAASAQGRYAISADGQDVTDAKTNLVWRRCAEGMRWDGKACAGKPAKFTYGGAKQAAAAVPSAAGNAWRVPTRDELVSLLDPGAKKKPKVDTAAFPNTPSSMFWASRPGSDDNLNAWLVNFGNGKVLGNVGQAKFPLRLVRSGS